MQKSKSLSELLARGGNRLSQLKERSVARSQTLEQVRQVLSPKLAQVVASAGIENGRLTIGVLGAQWASRLRYLTDALRKGVTRSSGLEILSVRIRVVAPNSPRGPSL